MILQTIVLSTYPDGSRDFVSDLLNSGIDRNYCETME